ncbi:MAG: hypothetical protein EBU84_12300 [Actinobacteria bacterium]|nr:hypothetical protein [Actinomycetota bacterium]
MALAQTTFPDDVHRDLRVAFYCGALIGYEFCLVFDALPTMDRLQADAFFDGAKHGEADRDEDDTADPYVMLDDDDDEYEHYEDDDHDEDLPIW